MGTLMQTDYWNGTAAERWIRYQRVLDRALDPFGVAALDALSLRPGQRVLDVGCGCGHTSLQLAERLGSDGYVCGIDPSIPMLEHARARAAGRSNIEFVAADAQQHRFETRFDHVYSRFGVMFFEDPTKAFRALRAALAPNGRVAFVCWREYARNPWGELPVKWAREVVPVAGLEPESDAPGPTSLANADRTAGILSAAGFKDIDMRSFEADVILSTSGLEDAVEFATAAGPAARALQQASAAEREQARAAIKRNLVRYLREDTVALEGSAWVVLASS